VPQRAPTVQIPGYESVALWIRDELMRRPTNPYELYRRYRSALITLARLDPKKVPRFSSFWRYLYSLKKLGLIHVAGRATKDNRRISIYAVVPGREDDPLWWKNPQRELARRRRWRPTWLGRRRYRRRVLGLPPGRPGRPRRAEQG